MFEKFYAEDNLKKILVPMSEYRPFPKVADRKQWDRLDPGYRAFLVKGGEAYLGHRWPSFSATAYLDFTRTGSRAIWEGEFARCRYALISLMLAESIENTGRFLDDITNGLWRAMELSTWVIPAHNYGRTLPDPEGKHDSVDLFGSEMGALFAWIYYMLKESLDCVDPSIAIRMKKQVQERILLPVLNTDRMWWMGLEPLGSVNNWNPWIIANVIPIALILSEDEDMRLEGTKKCLRCLDRFIASYFDDGGCDEGPSYWGAAGGALFDCLDALHGATDGKLNVYAEPLIKNIASYIYKVQLADNYFACFADSPNRLITSSHMIYRFGLAIGDRDMMDMGIAGYHHNLAGKFTEPSTNFTFRYLQDVFGLDEFSRLPKADYPLPADAWFADIHVAVTRETKGSVKGLTLAAKGGHNNESHNHNDVGSFILYADGKPMLIDTGSAAYTKRTFGPHRYEIWNMQSAYHNLPTVNGVLQENGSRYRDSDVSYSADGSMTTLGMDIAKAYPAKSGIQHWIRTFEFARGDKPALTITEKFALNEETSDIVIGLLSAAEAIVEGKKAIVKNGETTLYIEFDDALTGRVEEMDMNDYEGGETMLRNWGQKLYQIKLMPVKPMKSGEVKYSMHL